MSFARALVGFGLIRVHSGTPSGSSASFGVVEFILERRLAHSGTWRRQCSLGSFGHALVVFRLIPFHSGVPWDSLCSFALALGRRIHLLTLWVFFRFHFVLSGSFWRAMGVVPFVRWRNCVHSGSFGSFGHLLGVVGFIRFLSVPSGAPMGSSDSLGFVGFIRA